MKPHLSGGWMITLALGIGQKAGIKRHQFLINVAGLVGK
jgi:cell shape-determining protein MreC